MDALRYAESAWPDQHMIEVIIRSYSATVKEIRKQTALEQQGSMQQGFTRVPGAGSPLLVWRSRKSRKGTRAMGLRDVDRPRRYIGTIRQQRDVVDQVVCALCYGGLKVRTVVKQTLYDASGEEGAG
jgi:hypothetical protein